MNDVWKMWKKSFDSWENATAAYVEEVLKSPLVLGPSGTLLSEAMKARAKVNDRLAGFWGGIGLPTKRDQERGLHALNRLQSQLHDLEERLADLEAAGKKGS